jgi:hypothetical protein
MKKPRLALLILITCLCSYSVDRWFLSGLAASKNDATPSVYAA